MISGHFVSSNTDSDLKIAAGRFSSGVTVLEKPSKSGMDQNITAALLTPYSP